MKMRLVPNDRDHGWVPYVWLVFMAFFIVPPIFAPHTTARDWQITIAATAVFLVLYFKLFWTGPPWNYVLIGGIAGLVTALGVDAAFFHAPSAFWLPATIVSLGVGTSNIFFAEKNRANVKLRMAQDEIEHLAKVAERERIARDLHDVLGHTLSLIIVKSTLAGKLLEIDPAKAKNEIADIEKVSREAMADIRNTLRGYSTYKLCEEMQRAKLALESAGVTVESVATELTMSPALESVAALIMREAVTNVVRHAHARHCVLRIARNNGNCVLEVQDDGRGGFQAEGNGIRGMRERVEALGGTAMRDTSAGTKLRFEFPLTGATNGT